MHLRIIYLLLFFTIVLARQTPSATVARPQELNYHSLRSYPAYQIVNSSQAIKASASHDNNTKAYVESPGTSTAIPPEINSQFHNDTSKQSVQPASILLSSNTTPSMLDASTANTIYTAAEFPHDLLEIARSKLGLKNLDEVPSIGELAEFLGTNNAEETIKYVRQLTSTEQGIALIKAYLESADFTNHTEELRQQHQQQTSETSTDSAEMELTKEMKNTNLLDRVAAYFNVYNLWPKSNDTDAAETRQTVEQQLSKHLKPQLYYLKRLQTAAKHPASTSFAKPPRGRNSYYYPIPLRPILGKTGYANIAPPTPVHLNTPRQYVPPHVQLALAINIPPQQLQSLLQSKPKLAELAAKASHFTLNDKRVALFDAQVLAAVKRAVAKDDDLRRLLETTAATLK